MAYNPIANYSTQFVVGNYGGWYLKAYAQGTTTPISIATDPAGGTLLAKAYIDPTTGFIKTASGGTIFIPHLNAAYDLWIFPTSTEADADDTANAVQIADNMIAPASSDSLEWGATGLTATYISSTSFSVDGDQTASFIEGRELKTTGGADRRSTVVSSSYGSVTTVTVRNVQTFADPPSASTLHASMDTVYLNINGPKQKALTNSVPFSDYEFHNKRVINVITDYGVTGDGTTDDYANFQLALDDAATLGYEVFAPSGYTYALSQAIRLEANYMRLRVEGTLKTIGASATAALQIGSATDQASYCDVYVYRIDGQAHASGRDGIHIRWSHLSKIKGHKIEQCRYGIHMQQTSNSAGFSTCTFDFQEIRNCDRGIYHENASGGVTVSQTEGHIFTGGQIVYCDYGIIFDSLAEGGGCYITLSAVDCSGNAGSYDYVNNMNPTNTSGNTIISYIPGTNNDNVYMRDDSHLRINKADLMLMNGLRIISSNAFNPMYMIPMADADNGIRICGDVTREAGACHTVYGGSHATYPGQYVVTTPNAASNALVVRLVVDGVAAVSNIKMKNAIFLTDGAASTVYNGTSGEDGVAIHGSSDTGLPSNVSVQRGAGVNLYLSKPAGWSDGTLVSFRVSGAIKGSISTDGSTTAYNTSSDYRLKENVQPLTGCLDRVKQLLPSTFNFIGETKACEGFIAHELQAVVPGAVTGEKDAVDEEGPAYQQVDMSKLVPVLVAALQEAIARIEALEGV